MEMGVIQEKKKFWQSAFPLEWKKRNVKEL